MTPIATNLRKARERAHLSVYELAREAHVPASVIYRIENGEAQDPRISTLTALADALGLSLDQLAGHAKAAQISDATTRDVRRLLNEALRRLT